VAREWIQKHSCLPQITSLGEKGDHKHNVDYWREKENVLNPLLDYLINDDKNNKDRSAKETTEFFNNVREWCQTNYNYDDYDEEIQKKANELYAERRKNANMHTHKRELRRKELAHKRQLRREKIAEWQQKWPTMQHIRCWVSNMA
jgi:hypothetical protein